MSAVKTVFDAAISHLVDASNALSEADDLPSDRTRLLAAMIDTALVEAHRQQERIVRLIEDDGPDPDQLRDEAFDRSTR